MNIHEYQAKQLFLEYGIPVPDGKQTATAENVLDIINSLGGESWVVKAQVHAGGRGKAGGVKLAKSGAEAEGFQQSHVRDSLGYPSNRFGRLASQTSLDRKNLSYRTRTIPQLAGRQEQRTDGFYRLSSGWHGY